MKSIKGLINKLKKYWHRSSGKNKIIVVSVISCFTISIIVASAMMINKQSLGLEEAVEPSIESIKQVDEEFKPEESEPVESATIENEDLSDDEIKQIEEVVPSRDKMNKSDEVYSANNSNVNQNSLNTSHRINMGCILQNPGLPTGCEATSLTMVLNYLGYSVDKSVIAGNFLPRSINFYKSNGQSYGPDFRTTFAGNPFTEYGYGCLAPAIVTTANNYLASYGRGDLEVINASGSSIYQLYEYINQDIPVVIWATMYMKEPYKTASWYTPSGELVTWTAQEHCLVLIGYDNNNVVVNDPLVGTTTYNRALFEKRYSQLGAQAVVLKKKPRPIQSTPTQNQSSENDTSKQPSVSQNNTSSEYSSSSTSSVSSSSSSVVSSSSGVVSSASSGN